jgi:hypothetical protein
MLILRACSFVLKALLLTKYRGYEARNNWSHSKLLGGVNNTKL